MEKSFPAMVIDSVDGKTSGTFSEISMAELPDYDVLVEIAYSTLNYKDGLAITGKGRIARRMPMIAGVDLAGTVVESRSPKWQPGDEVVLNGWGLSETEWGAYCRYQRVKAEWLIRLPDSFSMQEAMAIGTAGYTAALCVDALGEMGHDKAWLRRNDCHRGGWWCWLGRGRAAFGARLQCHGGDRASRNPRLPFFPGSDRPCR